MLSIENIPDPSCSSRAPSLKADERASDPVGLVETQTSSFSIRDYAFASRRKGIETNWPFSQRFLQLCLKHGIKELLPSFEPPDLVRSQCWRKPADLEADHIISRASSLEIRDAVSNGFDPKSCLPSEELVLEADQYPSQKEGKHIVGEVLDHDQIEGISSQISEVEFARHLPRPKRLEISQDLSGKKCKLVLKLSASSQSRRTEDIASTSSTISDPMASKVCPVCKLFSSTSNTTLNAHIDQCLFTESNTNTEETKISNLKVKPSKKRLMVDIYATAPYRTLEDLDRRNVTTWARDLALVAPASEAPPEIKKPRVSPVDIRCDGGDEAVYVDSNGIKLRILSPMMPREESKPGKPAKEISEGKEVMCSKNRQFGHSYLKHTTEKPLCKKLSSFEMPRGESEASPVSDCHIEGLKEKEEAHSAVDDLNHNRHIGSATLRQWVCSKRSDLPKKMKKSIHQFSENPEIMTQHKDSISSSRIKNSDLLQTANNEKTESSNPHVHKVKWSPGSTLSNGGRLKLSRSFTASSTSPKKTREEYLCSNAYQDASRPSETCQPLMKAKKIVSLKKNILVRRPSFPLEAEAGNGDAVEKSPRIFRKKRSILVTSNRGGELLSSDGNGACKKVRTLRSSYSTSALRSGAKEYVEQMSPKGKNTQDAEYHDIIVPTSNSKDKVSCDTIISDHAVSDFIHDVGPKPTGGKFVSGIKVAHEMDFRGKGYKFRESRAKTLSAQESSACLTSHGDQGLEVRPENLSVTSSEKRSLASDRETSLSPGSAASAIFTPSRRPERQHCCCSRREGLSGEFPFSVVPSKGKQISNLYITPSLPSVSCSIARFESPNKSNVTKLSVDPAASFPTGLGSNGIPSTPQTPSTPNSVLRLMGKNLMVLKEEPAQHSRTVSNQESFWYNSNYQSSPNANHQFPHPKKPSSPVTSHFLPYQKQAAKSSRNPYSMKEGNDSPDTNPERVSNLPVVAGSNTMAQQRPFSCFSISHGQYIPRDVSGGFRLVYPKPVNPVKSPEGFRPPLLPSPLFYKPVFYPY